MLYGVSLYAALTIFGFGLIYKTAGWFRFSIGTDARNIPASARIRAALNGILAVLCSKKILTVLRVVVLDVLLQARILKTDGLRWLMHMLIFIGFMFLLLMHAFDRIITTRLFDAYYLTLNPYLLISGALVLSGIAIAVFRRLVLRVPRLKTRVMDGYTLIILALILISGFALESTKLTSFHYYQNIWYVHILACFVGLAWLPFSKLFHVFTVPASLLANAVMDENSDPANVMTRQVMELDACTQCGTCSYHCSVSVAFDCIGNETILPSEKMRFLKDYVAGKDLSARGLAAIREGIYLCTNCDRCTVVCPSGIKLRDLWFRVREEFVQRESVIPIVLTPFSFHRGLSKDRLDPEQYSLPIDRAQNALVTPFHGKTGDVISLNGNGKSPDAIGLYTRAADYSYCYTCRNCSTVCPVVANYENPQEHLDLLPHQIVRSVVFGLKDLAMGSRMLWDCLTCYQCQEHCPQGVKVTDLLYELKNQAVKETDCSSEPVLMNALAN